MHAKPNTPAGDERSGHGTRTGSGANLIVDNITPRDVLQEHRGPALEAILKAGKCPPLLVPYVLAVMEDVYWYEERDRLKLCRICLGNAYDATKWLMKKDTIRRVLENEPNAETMAEDQELLGFFRGYLFMLRHRRKLPGVYFSSNADLSAFLRRCMANPDRVPLRNLARDITVFLGTSEADSVAEMLKNPENESQGLLAVFIATRILADSYCAWQKAQTPEAVEQAKAQHVAYRDSSSMDMSCKELLKASRLAHKFHAAQRILAAPLADYALRLPGDRLDSFGSWDFLKQIATTLALIRSDELMRVEKHLRQFLEPKDGAVDGTVQLFVTDIYENMGSPSGIDHQRHNLGGKLLTACPFAEDVTDRLLEIVEGQVPILNGTMKEAGQARLNAVRALGKLCLSPQKVIPRLVKQAGLQESHYQDASFTQAIWNAIKYYTMHGIGLVATGDGIGAA